MKPRDDERLQDMLESARKAVRFARGKSRSDLDTDELLSLGLVRLIEIIGEAARNVSDTTKLTHPEIQWRQIAATRDRLIHAYSSVDLDIIWDIVQNDLPPLISSLEQVLHAKGT
ncbi:MAG: DUF86 domain-containing protein [Chloroflexi bacterium]|jgi:uncharacterized protein with HEPN domain|nr:MAG: DUF86 domain-containing protein [Chloroflexota bacterium]